MRRESWGRLALGLGTGVGFGVLLQKGRAAKHEVIADQLLMRDHSVVKIMATASAVGAVGTYALQRAGVVEASVKPLMPVATAVGGALFGAGLALLGYCPGTSVAAVGEGRPDAIAGVAGMAAGAVAFTRLSPRLEPWLERDSRGARTLPEVTATPRWLWVAGLAAAVAGGAALAERRR